MDRALLRWLTEGRDPTQLTTKRVVCALLARTWIGPVPVDDGCVKNACVYLADWISFFKPATTSKGRPGGRWRDDDDDDFKAGRNRNNNSALHNNVQRVRRYIAPLLNPFIHSLTSFHPVPPVHLCRVRRFFIVCSQIRTQDQSIASVRAERSCYGHRMMFVRGTVVATGRVTSS